MKSPVTKEYLDGLRTKLIAAEKKGDRDLAQTLRDEYRLACAAAYSSGDLVFKLPPAVSLKSKIT